MEKRLPVRSMQALLQSGQVNLYTPNNANLSMGGFLCVSRLSKVLLVRNAIFKPVCLKVLVLYGISLPTYVKVAHLC